MLLKQDVHNPSYCCLLSSEDKLGGVLPDAWEGPYDPQSPAVYRGLQESYDWER